MRIQYSDGITFDWLNGRQCWTLASKNVQVDQESNTRLEKRGGGGGALEMLTIAKLKNKLGTIASVFEFKV